MNSYSALHGDTVKWGNLAPFKEPETFPNPTANTHPVALLSWQSSQSIKTTVTLQGQETPSNTYTHPQLSALALSWPLHSAPVSGHCRACICHLLSPSKAETGKGGALLHLCLSPCQKPGHPWECRHVVLSVATANSACAHLPSSPCRGGLICPDGCSLVS